VKKIEDLQTLFQCLKLFDTRFTRRISGRVGSLEQYAYKLLENAQNYYADVDGTIAGFVSFYANHSDTAYLTLIAVDEKYARKGLGTKLLGQAILCSNASGMKRLKLEVDLKNGAAIKFYKKNGFETENNASEDSIYMVRDI